MMNEETRASLNKFLKEREERIKNMTLAEARDVVSSIYGHSDMRMESDKALQMLLDCADKALDQGNVLEKIRAEIEAEINNYSSMWVGHNFIGHTDQCIENILHNVLCQAKEQVLNIIDKYKAESGDEG